GVGNAVELAQSLNTPVFTEAAVQSEKRYVDPRAPNGEPRIAAGRQHDAHHVVSPRQQRLRHRGTRLQRHLALSGGASHDDSHAGLAHDTFLFSLLSSCFVTVNKTGLTKKRPAPIS